MTFGVDKRGQLIIHRYGVCTVILSGLPTATPGLTHFLKLDGNQQQYTTGMPDTVDAKSKVMTTCSAPTQQPVVVRG